MHTQLYCHSRFELSAGNATSRGSRRRGKPSQTWFLNIIIFGPKGLEDRIGEYFSRFRMYLQDPLGCERCVPYINPHIFPPDSGETIMADSFNSPLGDIEVEQLEARPDLLALLVEENTPLLEIEVPYIVTTPLFAYVFFELRCTEKSDVLHRHQKQALGFMMGREQGWSLDGGCDVWSRRKDTLGRFRSSSNLVLNRHLLILLRYINNVNGRSMDEAPPSFRGGLLADEMGLGKTLSMLALIAADQTWPDFHVAENFDSRTPHVIQATLVIAPAPCTYKINSYHYFTNTNEVIQAWEKQISRCVF
jgi:hypothetical protein